MSVVLRSLERVFVPRRHHDVEALSGRGQCSHSGSHVAKLLTLAVQVRSPIMLFYLSVMQP